MLKALVCVTSVTVPSPCRDPRGPLTSSPGAPGGRAPESETPRQGHAGLSRPLPRSWSSRFPTAVAVAPGGRSGLHSLNPRLQVSGWRLAPQPEWRDRPGDGGWFCVCGSFWFRGGVLASWPVQGGAGTRATAPVTPACDSRRALPVGVSAAFLSADLHLRAMPPSTSLGWLRSTSLAF